LSRAFRPADPAALPDLLAERIHSRAGLVRVAVDGAPAADPHRLADALIEPLRLRGRPAVHVPATLFWRDAALRLEYGREDVESYATWLDAEALRREVLDSVVTSGEYLPSLRDPATNRSTREPARRAAPGTVLIVSGAFLLGAGLPFELTVHLDLSPGALARRTPADQQWTLAAFERYRTTVDPATHAGITVRGDDPRHPAVQLR
jgi:hypothetical protein